MTDLANGLPLHADLPLLRVDEGGAVRVGKSRVSLDLVVEQYENGMTPEDMVRACDTLALADVHAVIAYYLRHRDEVRAYLKRREEEAAALQAKIELVEQNQFPSRSRAVQEAIRDKLQRLQRSRLARESAKLDPAFEQALADEGLMEDSAQWPEY